MVNVKLGGLLQEDIQNASKVIFENDSELTKRDSGIDLANLSNGSSIVLIASEDDLPPLIDGFRTLEFDKNYIFTEAAFYMDKILFPAGWTGSFRKSFFNSTSLIYLGTGPMFNTLLIDGIIDSIADSTINPGVKSTVTTSVAHGLLDGQFVNITDTNIVTAYSQQSLQVSNVTATTFDIEIVFSIGDTGLFNTGSGSIQFIDFGIIGNGSNSFMISKLTGDPNTSVIFTRFSAVGFFICGEIFNAPNVLFHDCIFAFILVGLALSDCGAVIETTGFIALDSGTGGLGLDITGSTTKLIGVFNTLFTMTASNQFPVFISNTIIDADELLFQNSPDNNVTDEYFDTVGLDETDPQVITINNGIRKNSQTIGSAFVNGNTVQTSIAISDAFQDIDFGTLTISASMERYILSNAVTGEFTYIGLKPINSPLSMSITIRKVSGSTQIYNIKFVIDKGAGFVDFADNIILPFEVKTTNDSGPYECQAQLENGDIIKPQISGIGTADAIIVDSASINF